MKNMKWLSTLVLATILSSCSAMSQNVRKEADTSIPFDTLKQHTEEYIGKTVILGGYVLEVRNLPQATHIIVLQTPLDFQDHPKQRDQSQGRFIVMHEGFLDPAVYEEGRMITVGGPVIGKEIVKVDGYSYPTVAVKSVEIHLWVKEEKRQTYPFFPSPFYDPFFYDPFYPWPGPYRHPYYLPRHRTKRR